MGLCSQGRRNFTLNAELMTQISKYFQRANVSTNLRFDTRLAAVHLEVRNPQTVGSSWFLKILVLILLYFGGRFYYNKKKLGLEGQDAIPHYELF